MSAWGPPSSEPGGEAVELGPLPAGARRLFAHYDESELASAPGFVTARLLEDGDRRDLSWLFARLGSAAIAAWVERHGARQLSRRSLAYWRLHLGLPEPAAGAKDLEGELWLL